MASVVVHQAGWLAIPLLIAVAIAFIVVATRLLPPEGRFEAPRATVVVQSLRFSELYSLFRIGPLAREEWPVLQSEANRAEDANLIRFTNRKLQNRGKQR